MRQDANPLNRQVLPRRPHPPQPEPTPGESMIMGSFGRYPVETTHDAPMSSCVLVGVVEAPGVGVQGAVDGVGQVALEDAEAGFAGFVLVAAAAGEQGGRAG